MDQKTIPLEEAEFYKFKYLQERYISQSLRARAAQERAMQTITDLEVVKKDIDNYALDFERKYGVKLSNVVISEDGTATYTAPPLEGMVTTTQAPSAPLPPIDEVSAAQ